MNEAERKAFDKYIKLGYDVIRNGIPDLMLLKEGKIEFVEIKTEPDKLRDNQKNTINLLRKHGIPVKIETVKKQKSVAVTDIDRKLPRQTVWLDDRGRLTVPAYLLKAAGIEKPSFVTVEADPNLEECKLLLLVRG